MSGWDRVIGFQHATRSYQKQAQESQRRPKTGPREPKMTQNEARGAPKRPQEAPKRLKKANPNRKTTKEPNQDDPKTVLDRPRADYHQFSRPPGAPCGSPKRHQHRLQNDQKSKRKIKRQKELSKTILDPSWGDIGSFGGAILGEKTSETICFKRFREKTLFRR